MDRQVIDQKLESLRRCLVRIQDKCPAHAAELQNNFDLQDIIALNLSRAVQLTVDIGSHIISTMNMPAPETMEQTFEILAQQNVLPVNAAEQLKKSVGFRNTRFITTKPSIGKSCTASSVSTSKTSLSLLEAWPIGLARNIAPD